MCYKIDASFVLIHLLKKDNWCTISQLVKKKNMIENKIPSVFVDVSKDAVLSSIEYYPEIFEFKDDRICKRKNSEEFFNESVIPYFSLGVEDSIKCQISSLLENG